MSIAKPEQGKKIFNALIRDEKSVFYGTDNSGKKDKKLSYKKVRTFLNIYLKLEDKKVV